ncbi:MAG TPA: carboxypeptidase-like regulatory domain-containing protein, partial [Chitinophagaceae bacterium]|nr:carboxypeptidase-like regulatory domain-containing protein [Chitinophagaceae bacterium]
NFKINQLPTGNYKIKFEKNNYKPVEKNNITIKQDSTSKINIEITEKEETTYESIIWDLRFGI